MTDIDVMAVGLWAERQPLKVTLYQHLAQSKGKYCLELIFLKIPWCFLEWSLGGGRSNCEPGRTISTLQSLGTPCDAVGFVQAGERFPQPSEIKIGTSFSATAHKFKLLVKQKSELCRQTKTFEANSGIWFFPEFFSSTSYSFLFCSSGENSGEMMFLFL